ncbi:MAG TPA: DUF5676 family membrane protein [Candidatus Eisenbacteria bacterium]|nr:DUF5676 family membrane protein [Candidatus Eisenbacteria bacterium]
MKLDTGRFAIAVGTIWAAAGLICGLVYKIAPESYARTANFLLHSDMYRATRVFGWGELALATAAWWFLAAGLAGASAAMYNRSIRT